MIRREPQWVFVHGAAGSSDFWELVRPDFPGAWMVDLPGHEAGHARRSGQAQVPLSHPPLRTVAAFAEWLIAAIERRGWPDVVLVGHSLGGAIVQTVGLRRPPWLRGLVLSGTGARLRVAPEFLRLLASDYAAAVEWSIARQFAAPPAPYRREGIRRAMLRIPAEVSRADYAACDAFDLLAPLRSGALAGPVVIVCGDQDQMTPPTYSAFLAAHISGAAHAVIPGAGHMAPIEQPAAWSATVGRLWALQATATHPEA